MNVFISLNGDRHFFPCCLEADSRVIYCRSDEGDAARRSIFSSWVKFDLFLTNAQLVSAKAKNLPPRKRRSWNSLTVPLITPNEHTRIRKCIIVIAKANHKGAKFHCRGCENNITVVTFVSDANFLIVNHLPQPITFEKDDSERVSLDPCSPNNMNGYQVMFACSFRPIRIQKPELPDLTKLHFVDVGVPLPTWPTNPSQTSVADFAFLVMNALYKSIITVAKAPIPANVNHISVGSPIARTESPLIIRIDFVKVE